MCPKKQFNFAHTKLEKKDKLEGKNSITQKNPDRTFRTSKQSGGDEVFLCK